MPIGRDNTDQPEERPDAPQRVPPTRPQQQAEEDDAASLGEIRPGDEDGLPDRPTRHRVPS
jgi:hypothetical protein